MGWFARGWFDRLLGRGRQDVAEPAATRARAREEEAARSDDAVADDLEEGAHAARDELVARHEPMKPPGTA